MGKEKVTNWICDMEKKQVFPFDCSFSNSFGTIKMSDGRNAQIQVTLEMDVDNWI